MAFGPANQHPRVLILVRSYYKRWPKNWAHLVVLFRNENFIFIRGKKDDKKV